MHILLIHQYFLEKDDGGGSRFNEMAKVWVELGHEVTIIAGMVHYNTGKKHTKYKGKFIFKDEYSEKTTVIRCHVSEAYDVNFIGRLWAYFSFVFSAFALLARCFLIAFRSLLLALDFCHFLIKSLFSASIVSLDCDFGSSLKATSSK